MDMQQIMEQARLMQQQLEDAQNNMGEIELTATAGGGMVTVTGTADMKVTSITIDPEKIPLTIIPIRGTTEMMAFFRTCTYMIRNLVLPLLRAVRT